MDGFCVDQEARREGLWPGVMCFGVLWSGTDIQFKESLETSVSGLQVSLVRREGPIIIQKTYQGSLFYLTHARCLGPQGSFLIIDIVFHKHDRDGIHMQTVVCGGIRVQIWREEIGIAFEREFRVD